MRVPALMIPAIMAVAATSNDKYNLAVQQEDLGSSLRWWIFPEAGRRTIALQSTKGEWRPACILSAEFVARSVDSAKVYRTPRVFFQFLPEAKNMGCNRARRRIDATIPDFV
jgi:hypothetical protein